jgi:hypothetical protein
MRCSCGPGVVSLRCPALPEQQRQDDWTESERVFLDHLERRRGELAIAQWQAPGLTIAAQAFLLQVLANTDIDASARKWVLWAGITASIAALAALLRLRQREVKYSDAIAHYGAKGGMRDPRLQGFKGDALKRWDPFSLLDRLLRWVAGWSFLPGIHFFWVAALILFIFADVYVYRATT